MMLGLLTGILLGGAAAALFLKVKRPVLCITPSFESELRETLLFLEGDEAKEPKDLPELLERLEAIARNLQGRYNVLVDNLAAAVVVYDENWRIRFISPYTELLTGHTAEEFYTAQEDIFESISVERYARAKKVSQLGEDFHVQYQIRHRSGVMLWLDTRMVPITDEDGGVIGLLAVTIDVTESIRQRKQLEEQNQDLKDFSYMVSHDLKAPIFTIKGMVAALREDYAERLDADANGLLNYIVEGADRLEKLVSSVIEYSSITIRDSKIQSVFLGEILKSVLTDLSEQIRISEAKIVIPSSLPYLKGDPVRLYQVFSNLFGNAIKYRSPERALSIELRITRLEHDFVKIEIKDNGLGIPPGKLSDIFRPYHRAHSSEIEGSGIGLASVKKIVEKAGGSVSVVSEEGAGSIFSVVIPAAQVEERLESLRAD
jgi:PAS domain S-box-containing protein